MPSIFIWKASENISSNDKIKVFSGSNWVLEEYNNSSKSVMYIDQIVISESNNSVITFHYKEMPTDWIGSELLEVNHIPYKLIKSDSTGTLEQLGHWMRFTSKHEIEFNTQSLTNEFKHISKWMTLQTPSYSDNPEYSNNTTYPNKSLQSDTAMLIVFDKKQIPANKDSVISTSNTDLINSIKITHDFNQFLNKYKLPVLPISIGVTANTNYNSYNSKNMHNSKYRHNKVKVY